MSYNSNTSFESYAFLSIALNASLNSLIYSSLNSSHDTNNPSGVSIARTPSFLNASMFAALFANKISVVAGFNP